MIFIPQLCVQNISIRKPSFNVAFFLHSLAHFSSTNKILPAIFIYPSPPKYPFQLLLYVGHFHFIPFESGTKIQVPHIWGGGEEELHTYGVHKEANKYIYKLLAKETYCIDCSETDVCFKHINSKFRNLGQMHFMEAYIKTDFIPHGLMPWKCNYFLDVA